MKSLQSQIGLGMLLLLSTSCSDNHFEKAENDADQQLINQLLSEKCEPYISPGMQKLINLFEATGTDGVSEEEIAPFLDCLNTFVEKSDLSGTSTRVPVPASVEGTKFVRGYNLKEVLFYRKKITLRKNNSALRNALGFIYYYTKRETEDFYISCYAIIRRIYFPTPVDFYPAHEKSDEMGINPNTFTDFNITDETYLTKGFHCEIKREGELYFLTSYAFGFTPVMENAYSCWLVPTTGRADCLIEDFDQYASNYTWRFYQYEK